MARLYCVFLTRAQSFKYWGLSNEFLDGLYKECRSHGC